MFKVCGHSVHFRFSTGLLESPEVHSYLACNHMSGRHLNITSCLGSDQAECQGRWASSCISVVCVFVLVFCIFCEGVVFCFVCLYCYGRIVYINRRPLQSFGVELVDISDMLYIGNGLYALAHWIAPWVLRTCLF